MTTEQGLDMPTAIAAQILHVDLSSGSITIERPPESFLRTYLGGSAMGLSYILRDVPPGTDGLDPANIMTLMLSPLTGTPIAGQSRITISARSPLTDGIGDSQGGGYFPAELRFSGFMGIVVRGRAPEPVFLWIHDGEAELRPAGHLWGSTTSEVTDRLKDELGDDRIEVAAIGPAGEKVARLAAIMSMGNRANGRTGMGAVMGSKNLKAIAVRGTTRTVPIHDGAALSRLAKWGASEVPNNPDVLGLRADGTQERSRGPACVGWAPDLQLRSGTVRRVRGDLRARR